MTAYSDLPQVNILYQQRENITNCIAALDDGGQLGTISIIPPAGTGAMGMGMMLAPVQVPQPTPPDTLANTRAILVQMQSDIDAQLADLGVVETPPAAPDQPPARLEGNITATTTASAHEA